MAAPARWYLFLKRRILYIPDHRRAAASTGIVFRRSDFSHSWYLLLISHRKHSVPETAEAQQKILLSEKTHDCHLRPSFPYEAKRGRAGFHYYSGNHGFGDGIYYGQSIRRH